MWTDEVFEVQHAVASDLRDNLSAPSDRAKTFAYWCLGLALFFSVVALGLLVGRTWGTHPKPEPGILRQLITRADSDGEDCVASLLHAGKGSSKTSVYSDPTRQDNLGTRQNDVSVSVLGGAV